MNIQRQVALVQIMSPVGEWVNVGFLRNQNEFTRFEYAPGYWNDPNRPILGQVFEERGRDWMPSQRVALPTWFSHLLPEGYLRHAVSAAIGGKPQREFPMLIRLGESDLPGAVRVLLSDEEDDSIPDVEDFHTHEEEQDDEEAVLKFSLAGVQPKFSVMLDPVKGLTIPARGQAGDFIVKLPDGRPGFERVPEAELAALTLAKEAGITVPSAFLCDVSEISGLPEWARSHPGKALAIRRFDRLLDGGRVHAEVLAQVLDVPTANERLKYTRANFETIASVVDALCGADSALEVIDRIVLNVLVGNGDAHLKNWAVIYPDGVTPELSPAFDILPTVLYIKDDNLGVKLNNSRSFTDVSRRSFDRLADRVGLSRSEVDERVAETVSAVEMGWSVLGEFLDLKSYNRLTAWRNKLPLFQSFRS
ncbi:putative kinase Y4dM [Asanoa ishikariensis]|uniref:Serine/threonine-protein kinase HipA n=1 Tax=Asanoa ishikariensis TaxID=137265 RepID=A0A1H3RXV4_9ACTN|nr:type II toxin-antitoxin system HipA family toxin [Asanoa ishikariensis]GIF66737.1 putative kinase Y4dM [Asanoa ishikariensis]SDZ30138.1 serine/threonine-protein kinase HipA [Asanoa ishikariensis]